MEYSMCFLEKRAIHYVDGKHSGLCMFCFYFLVPHGNCLINLTFRLDMR